MTDTVEILVAQATQLPSAQRVELVERILDSLAQPDAPRDALLAKEAVDRLAAYRRGEMRAVTLFDVIDKHSAANTGRSSGSNPPASDPALAALAALSRAGLRAAEDARRANTHMVVEENGTVLHESPQEYLRKRGEQPPVSDTKGGA